MYSITFTIRSKGGFFHYSCSQKILFDPKHSFYLQKFAEKSHFSNMRNPFPERKSEENEKKVKNSFDFKTLFHINLRRREIGMNLNIPYTRRRSRKRFLVILDITIIKKSFILRYEGEVLFPSGSRQLTFQRV